MKDNTEVMDEENKNDKNFIVNFMSNRSDEQLIGVIIGAILVFGVGFALMGGGFDVGQSGEYNTPEWADSNGIVMNEETGEPAFQQAIQSHTDTLSQDSYKISVTGESNSLENEQEESSTLEYVYNPESNTAHGVQEANGMVTETFDQFSEERQLVAQNLGTENVEYDRQPLLQPIPFTGASEFVELMSIMEVEATDVNGDTVVYSIVGTNDEFVPAELDVDVSGEIHLNSNGYFEYMNVNIEDSEQGISTSQEITVSDIGSTTVEEPEWVQTALDETDELTEEDFEPPEQQIPEGELPDDVEEEPPAEGDEPIIIE